jgi:hypothetical protein
MSRYIMSGSKPVKRKYADRYFRLNLLSFAASVTLIRVILEAMGYPQLRGETLHIAHVLPGGVLLYAGSLIPLVYANRWVYNWSSVLSGVGGALHRRSREVHNPEQRLLLPRCSPDNLRFLWHLGPDLHDSCQKESTRHERSSSQSWSRWDQRSTTRWILRSTTS